MSKRFICVGEAYESNGEKKIFWNRIGELFVGKNGKEYCKLYHIPNTLLNVFEDKKKEANTAKQSEFGPLAPDDEVPF